MQTMKARTEESQQEDNAFKALQAVASTTSENYKDDEAYQHYRDQHQDVPEREREFLKTLIHFQTQNLQIFDRKQAYIKNLEDQLKAQEELKKELEEAKAREMLLQQQVHQAERIMQQATQQHQEDIRVREEQMKVIEAQNAQLIKEKEKITQKWIFFKKVKNLFK